ncbi:MAG TPA: tyrosine-type recombinase/integrase [Accumulibacter sp.]|nr:tyrosine-type recombinase/integrase [Accumulibacter sp.]
MPKGIKGSKPTGAHSGKVPNDTSLCDALIVPIGATHYPSLDGTPGAEELPPGISVRSRRSIQVEYSTAGGRRTVRLPRVPTVQAVRAAARFRSRLTALIEDDADMALVEQLIQHELKQDEVEALAKPQVAKPTSRQEAKTAAPARPTEGLTCGEALDEYLCAGWTSLSPNTKKDYVGYIRSRFKPADLSEFGLADDHFVAGRHSGPQPPDAHISKTLSAAPSQSDWRPTSTIPCVREYVDRPLEPGEAPSARWKRRRADWKRAGAEAAGPSPETMKRVAQVRLLELPLRCFGQLRVAALTDVVAAAMVAVWLRTLSRKTVVNFLGFLKPAFARLVAKGVLDHNPFAQVTVSKAELSSNAAGEGQGDGATEVNYLALTPEQAKTAVTYERDETEPDPLSDDEMVAILEHLEPAMREHYGFAFMTGLRTGEQLALKAKDYDKHNSRIRVRRSQSRGLEKRTKTALERWVYLNPVAKEILERAGARCSRADDYLFVNPHTGQPWRGPNKLTKRWKRALEAAGIRYRRPYHTRHTYATLMLLAGESPYYVAAQLGHADLEMLEKRYARFIEAGRSRQPGAAMASVHASALGAVSQLLQGGVAPDVDGASGAVASDDDAVA